MPDAHEAPSPESPIRSTTRLGVGGWLGLLALAITARALAWYAFRGVEELRGDEAYYVAVGRSIAAGEGHPGSVRPPLHGFVLGGVFALAGGSLAAVRALQLALSVLTVALVARVAAVRFGRRAGLWTGALLALSPGLAHYAHFLWGTSLTATLVALLVWLLDRLERNERRGDLAAAALVLGLLILSRETWLYFVPVLALWVGWRARARGERVAVPVALALLGPLVVVAPWTVRNAVEQGHFVLVSTNRWFPVAMGNLYAEDAWFDEEDAKGLRRAAKAAAPATRSSLNDPGDFDSEQVREAYWKRVSLEAIAAHQPTWLAKKTVRNLAGLFVAKTQVTRFVRNGWVRPGRAWARALVLWELAGSALLFLPAILGLWLVRSRGAALLALLAILEVLGVHVLANAEPRFLVGIHPLFALFGGALLAGCVERERLRSWRLVAAVACAVAYIGLTGALLAPYLPEVWRGATRFGG